MTQMDCSEKLLLRENRNYEAILNYTKKINNISIVSLLGANRFDLRTSGTRLTAISLI